LKSHMGRNLKSPFMRIPTIATSRSSASRPV
jgi:hypothetical protein